MVDTAVTTLNHSGGSNLTINRHYEALHCGLTYTKKLIGSDFISNIKNVFLRNFKLLKCFLDLLWHFEDLKMNLFVLSTI